MITFRKAEAQDIPELVRNRVMFLNELNSRVQPPERFEDELEEFLLTGITDGSFVAWLADDGGEIASVGYICFYRIAPGYSNLSGKIAYIQNIYTLPGYRERGLASEILDKLVNEARERGYGKLTLHATAMGKKVYERYGFEPRGNEMELKIGC